MNEQRNQKMRYLSGKMTDSLEQDWENLLMRLQSLRQRAHICRVDLIKPIMRQENVLMKNKPNKKIYRTILKFADDIELQIANTTNRMRGM